MAQRRRTVSPQEAAQIKNAVSLLGEDTVRQLWRTEGRRLPRRERLANLEAGSGKVSPADLARLNRITRNAPALSRLQEQGEGNTYTDSRGRIYSQRTKDRRIARALKSWLLHGKPRDADYRTQSPQQRRKQQPAIKALLYLGVDLHTDDPDYGS